MSQDWFTSETNLKHVERAIRTGEVSGANADETLQMIGTIRRLRVDNRRLIAYEEAAELWTFRHDDAGRQRIVALANNPLRSEERDESYFTWLVHELAGLSDDEWERVKRTREG